MRAVVVRKVGAFAFETVEPAAPGPDEVRVDVSVAGLCRTDLKLIRRGHPDLTLPRVPGEEVVGVVREAGAEAGGWSPGERVYIYPGVWCGSCEACRKGAENLCRRMRIMGFHRDGGFAPSVTVPARSLLALPEGLSEETAVFAEPLSCCLNALELSRLAAGERLGVWGAGPAGTLLARAARARGAEVYVIEPDERRRGRAGGTAASPRSDFDVCVVAVGAAEAYDEALASLGPRGRLVVFSGLSPAEDGAVTVSLNRLHYREQTLVGAYGCALRHGKEALAMLAAGRVEVEDLVSHRLPLSRLEEALAIVAERRGMKVLLDPVACCHGQ